MKGHRLGDLAEGDPLVAHRMQDRAGGSGLDGQPGQAGGVGAVYSRPAVAAVTLRERGVREPESTLAAEAGMTVLPVAMKRWASGDDGCDLAAMMSDAVADLRRWPLAAEPAGFIWGRRRANGQPAFGVYVGDPHADIFHANGLIVLTLAGSRICELIRFDNSVLARFGLPRTLAL